MNKIFILQLCIVINIILISIFCLSFFIFNNQESSYFRCGWSDDFTFVSISINTPFKYINLCLFLIFFNMSEILLNDVGYPIIHFSTYNPYHKTIEDLTRYDLELYSNIIFFIQTFKKLAQVLITLSQFDIALVSLFSYQISSFIAIRYLLNNKEFKQNQELKSDYEKINETNPLMKNSKFNKGYISI